MKNLKLLNDEISKSEISLKHINNIGTISERKSKFFYFQFLDSFKLCIMARGTFDFGLFSLVFTAEAIEIITRNILEKAILCSYINKNNDTNLIDRYLKTTACEFKKSWEQECFTEEKNLNIKRLPDYKTMAISLDPEMYKTYKKLSYLSHPRSTLPYSLVEHEYIENKNITKNEFYKKRSNESFGIMGKIAHLGSNPHGFYPLIKPGYFSFNTVFYFLLIYR